MFRISFNFKQRDVSLQTSHAVSFNHTPQEFEAQRCKVIPSGRNFYKLKDYRSWHNPPTRVGNLTPMWWTRTTIGIVANRGGLKSPQIIEVNQRVAKDSLDVLVTWFAQFLYAWALWKVAQHAYIRNTCLSDRVNGLWSTDLRSGMRLYASY